MIEPNYVMKARVTRVIDGDTVVMTVSPAFKIELVDYKFRLHGIDTPEMNDADPAVREKAKQARDYLLGTILGNHVLVQTVQNTLGADKIDSFGRYLAVIYYIDLEGKQRNLNEELIEKGLAVPYRAN